MNLIRRSRSWITLAFVAMLAMAATPGFASTCCCGIPAAPSSCHHALDEHSSASQHAHCHEDAGEASDQDTVPALTAPATAVSHQAAPTESRTTYATSTGACCACQVNDSMPVTSSESPLLLSQLAPIVATLPVQAFALALPQQPGLGFIEYRAGPPRSSVDAAIPARAPPVI